MIRAGAAPAAGILRDPDHIIILCALASAELYGQLVPIVVIPGDLYATIGAGDVITVDAGDERATIARSGGR